MPHQGLTSASTWLVYMHVTELHVRKCTTWYSKRFFVIHTKLTCIIQMIIWCVRMHVLGVQRVRGCFDVISIILDPCIKKWLNMTASRSSCVRVAIPPTVQRIKSVLSEEGHQITNWSCTIPCKVVGRNPSLPERNWRSVSHVLVVHHVMPVETRACLLQCFIPAKMAST